MKEFEKMLLRMKQSAGVRTDREIADLLGMTVKAFTSRKIRDSFPEDKLLALTARRPELGIDANYVLTGEYRSVREARERISSQQATYKAGEARPVSASSGGHENWDHLDIPAFLRRTPVSETEPDTDEEKLLLECYSQATDEGKLAIMATAKAMAEMNQRQTK